MTSRQSTDPPDTSTSDTVAIEALVRGRVQGVWYRGWARDEAARRGLSGWVRNNADGTVSALFIGPRAAVEEMLAACREGPAAARVDAVETMPVDPVPDARDFRVLR